MLHGAYIHAVGTRAATETVTLFAVINDTGVLSSISGPTVSNFYTISAQGVGADGATTYVEEDHISRVLVDNAQFTTVSGTRTLAHTTEIRPVPTRTQFLTFVEDDSHIRYTQIYEPTSISGFGAIRLGALVTCSLDSKGGTGSCVEKLWQEGPVSQTSTETMTVTLTGTLVPIATLTVDSNAFNKQANGVFVSHLARVAFGYGLFAVIISWIWSV